MRSETCSTSMLSSSSTAAATARMWSASRASTVTSRTVTPASARTRSIAPSDAPVSAITRASSANAPGRSSSRTRNVALKDADRWLMQPPRTSEPARRSCRASDRRRRRTGAPR